MTIKILKYKKIIDKIKELGFCEFHQAGYPSEYHELNLVIKDKVTGIKYWICKSFGKFYIVYQKETSNLVVTQHRISCEKNTQKEVCSKFESLVKKLSTNTKMLEVE